MKISRFARRIGQRVRRSVATRGAHHLALSFQSCLDEPLPVFMGRIATPEDDSESWNCAAQGRSEALLEHLVQRHDGTWPAWPERLSKIYLQPADQAVAEADGLLQHCFTIGEEAQVRFGESVDWRYNPTPDPRARWTRELNRHRWLGALIRAYQLTGDGRYAACFRNMICNWISLNRPPTGMDESNPVWTLMGVGMRAVAWSSAYGAFRKAPEFDDRAQLLFLRSVWDHAEYLAGYRTHLNHLLREANGLETLGVYFPEFRDAPRWRAAARSRMLEASETQIYSDGVHVELSTGYQWLVADEFLGALELLLRDPDTSTEISRQFRTKVESLFEVLAYLARPDGTWPQLNDGFMDGPSALRERLAAAARQLQRSDLLFVASGGKQGHSPQRSSRVFREAGLVVMRSGWDSEACYLTFDAGPYGGPHGHEDALSIELFAGGQPFIVDPGCSTYHAGDPYRDYFVSSRSHSTVLIGGLGQVRRWDPQNLRVKHPSAKLENCLLSSQVDYAAGRYDGAYGAFKFRRPKQAYELRGVCHRRQIVFVKPWYWVLLDTVEGARQHQVAQLFQLHPQIEVGWRLAEIPGCRLQTSDSSSALWLVGIDDQGRMPLREEARGEEEPPAGWYSGGKRNHRVPSVTLRHAWPASEAESIVLATLLLPIGPTGKADYPPSLEWCKPTVPGETLLGVHSQYGNDLISVLPRSRERRLNGCAVTGVLSSVRCEPTGSVSVLFDRAP